MAVDRTTQFNSSSDIDKFFQSFNATGFVDWFNKNISSNSIWGISISNQANWQKVWSNINNLFGRTPINLIEFLCLNSVMINETGGSFTPLTEFVGNSGNPGISYAFNSISGLKSSYNTLSTNWNALTLFNDPVYNSVHGTKPLSQFLKNTTDNRWSGFTFPLGFSGNVQNETSSSGKTNGYIYEADYMKFRGRGLIQITGRGNYKSILSFIMGYKGNNSIILQYQKSWSQYSGNLDSICSVSTNSDWDTLFQKTNSIIANYGCYIHNTLPGPYVNYNKINPSQSDVNLNKSISNVGLAVSGSSTSYAKEFLQRVLIQLQMLDSMSTNNSNSTASSNKTAAATQSVAGRLETTGRDPNSQIGNNGDITGPLSIVTNIFKPTVKPGPISFNI